jgi:8-oxo-dGTP pyrophosphatase MutT (NUDIX family)
VAAVIRTATSSPFLTRLATALAVRQPAPAAEPGAIWAAVALVLAAAPDSILLIRRAERSGDPWSGQVGLPGGRRDPADADLLTTAIREATEEVGVLIPREACIGVLDDVAPRTPVLPPVIVRPFVFALETRPELSLNREVASAHWVELDQLTSPGILRPYTISLRGEPRTFPAYHVHDLVVWGLTERILSSLVDVASTAPQESSAPPDSLRHSPFSS